ncbi:MAG: AAA family ATPase [Candidatus Shapirobacteria bacterium]|nr:AAA family ATPase [Candidatus Shapirobacteria bacterium]MDD4410294.1 AAA family ATPase [Candidatus Shapirobacteria bacterium]
MIIIGITGTNGAGKGTIVEYLVEKKGFKHFSARAFLVEEIERRGLENSRDNMVMVANELRAKNSSSFVVDELFKRALESGQNCIIESIRTPGEIESLRKKGNFTLLAVDADPKIRYERIVKRSTTTDDISFEKFLADEEREMSSEDPNKQNLKKCIAMADFTIVNNKDINYLNQQIEEIYDQIK